jgi:hypothetical protein
MDLASNMDSKLFEILDKYSKDPEYLLGESLKQIIKNTRNSEMTVPVLGMQGMGKSTLINAVLGENILPNDADETTCVPVEVKYGTEQRADVFFRNGKPNVIAYTREDLNCYVDNNENPANEKDVSHIVLYRKLDLLKSGITIVDLPGVGSLTKKNEDTTNRYIQNLCTAIFVIPTVPTIRRQEASFIRVVWSQFSKAVFVQNDWGESKREINESVEFNSTVLKNIAKELNTDYDGNIIVVNAYNALAGAIQGDRQSVSGSNIDTLIAKIKELSENWTSDIELSIKLRCGNFIGSAKEELLRRKAQTELEEQAYKEAVQKEYEIYKEETGKISTLIDETDNYLRTKEDEMSVFAKNGAKTCAAKIRSEIYSVIDNKIYDGELLTKAFNDIQENCCPDFLDSCFMEFMRIRNDLESRMEQLEGIIAEKNQMKMESIPYYKKAAFKFEKSFTSIGSIAGGIGGVYASAAIGGAIGTAAGPLGTIVGVAAGIAITAIGGLIGSFITKGVRSGRASAVKSDLEPIILKLEIDMKKEVTKGFSEMCFQVRNQFKAIIEERKKEEKRLLERTVEDTANVTYDPEELDADLEYLNETEDKLRNV